MISEKTKKQIKTLIFYCRLLDTIIEIVGTKYPEIILEATEKVIQELEGDTKE